MKKILAITPFFYPHIGGSEGYMEGLYAYLKQKQPQIQVDVLCYNTDKAKEKEVYRGLNIYRIPCWTILPGQFCLPKPVPLFKFLKSNKSYDLIHCSTRFFDSSWWAPLYAKLTKTKIVLTDHCAYHPTSGKGFVRLAVRLVEATIVRFSLNFYDQIYVQNKKTGEFLKNTFGINSKLAYPGLDFRSGSFIVKNNQKINVVYVGRMIPSKGVETLFQIAAKTPKANFFFAGEGELAESLKKRVKENKFGNISILGSLSKAEVLKLLKSADIFAYPSWHSEGLPMALLEAGAMGIAVLATDSGATSELIKDGQTGVLVQKNDSRAFRQALDGLLKDRNLREKLGRDLQKFTLENFSWENAASLVLQNLQ
jgi:glycosyltransferase involved in cell wall biosynthesis